jgi:hypothetical protein
MDVAHVPVETTNEVLDAIRAFSGEQRPSQTIWFRGSRCSE